MARGCDEAGIDTSALTEQLEAEEADETAIADAAAAIEADPAAASVVGTAEFEDEDSGKVTTENVDLATFEETLTAAEPDPADFGVWVPGIPVLLEKLFHSMGVNEDGWVYSLVMDGIVAGVGAVLGFVPQMLILFFFLAILEDCGYMARVAFIMDRIFRKFGLSGKSFIPMLIGSGCGVPAVMASRTIEQERDRRMTIMTTCFVPCGAKLPIIAMFAGAFFGGSGTIAFSLMCWACCPSSSRASCSRSSRSSPATRLRSSWSCRAITFRPPATYSAPCGSAAPPSSRRQAPLSCCPPSSCGSPSATAGKAARSAQYPILTTPSCAYRLCYRSDLHAAGLRHMEIHRCRYLRSGRKGERCCYLRSAVSLRRRGCEDGSEIWGELAADLRRSARMPSCVQPAVRTVLRGNGRHQA